MRSTLPTFCNPFFSLTTSTKYGFYGYPKDPVLATTYLWFAAEAHSALASIALSTRFQTGDRQNFNMSRVMDIVLPVWKSIVPEHYSLFDALYLPKEVTVTFGIPKIRHSGPKT